MRANRDATVSWVKRVLGLAGRDVSAFDALEPRLVLSGGPLPNITDLESAGDTVVRLETNYGDIDIELYDSAAPITVGNFLNYVTSGRLDNTFFHRSAFSGGNPFVLQGGGFIIDDLTGPARVSTDAPIIREQTGKSNVARTVAMARTSDPNSATSQFFINYVNNVFLDGNGSPGNEGYAVFGKVVQGWDVVLAIQGLRSLNLAGVAPFSGTEFTGIAGEIPVSDSYIQDTRFTEAASVYLLNAEIIKPANVSGFYAQYLAMPEGFRSGSAVETLEIMNPNAASAGYQVIAHYETGIRDTVVARGIISANSTLEIALSNFANGSLNLLRTGTPYALIVETALPTGTANPQPIAASVNRADYGAAESEGMFNTTGYSDAELRDWLFPRIERNNQSREYLTWVNLSSQTATVTVDFTTSGGVFTFTRTLKPYRRGGLEVFSLGLPTGGNISARVRADQNIVAYLSDWDLPAPGQPNGTSYTPGFGVMGLPGGGATAGGIAGVTVSGDLGNPTSTLSIFNPGTTAAVVSLRLWRTSRLPSEDPIPVTRIIFSGGREDYVLDSATLGIPAGEQFTVTYDSGSAAIAVQWTSFNAVGRGQAGGSTMGDGVATLLTSRIAPTVHFTDGYFEPNRSDGSLVERISLFNPFADSMWSYDYTVRYSFSDGTTIDAFTGSLTTHGRIDLLTSSNSTLMNKIGSADQFRHYTISVTGVATQGGTNFGLPSTVTSAPLVVFTRTDNNLGRSVASTGSLSAAGRLLDDPVFLPGG